MHISILTYCVFAILGYIAELVVLYLILESWERTDSAVMKWFIGFVGTVASLGIFCTAAFPFYMSSQVIEVDASGRHKQSDWMISYRHNGESFPVRPRKWYVYNKDSENIDLVITPIYYHIDPDSVGIKIQNRMASDTLRGVFVELPHNPVFLFQPPDTLADTYVYRRELVLYHLGIAGDCPEIPDTYRRLMFRSAEYDTAVY